jgi:hypothetical protein
VTIEEPFLLTNVGASAVVSAAALGGKYQAK